MRIHWFPGHMAKAVKMMKEEVKNVDSVVYVLDARVPRSSLSDAFEPVIGNKSRLYVLNKADLVSAVELTKWVEYFRSKGAACIYTNSASKKDAPKIIKSLNELNAAVIARYREKGVNKIVRAMVIGIPNSGKSTLINSLAPSKRAVTGNRPGVTRGKQWISIGRSIELLDSPGVLYPDFSYLCKAVRLAMVGSIRDEVVDQTELAAEAYKIISRLDPEALAARYGQLPESLSPSEALEEIAKIRGLLQRGGVPDIPRVSQAFINDYRKGYLTKLPLDEL